MLQSPVIIITGASKGIGKAVTLSALNKFNARVVAIARSEALLTQLQQEVATDNLEIVVGDVTDDSICKKAVDRAIDRWGQLDSVIANAGVLEPISTVADAPLEGWKRLFDVNVFSVISLAQHAMPFLRKSENGSIIIVSSGAALKGYKGWGAYGASKATVNHLANTLSVEEKDVTTIAVRPGVVDTDMQAMIRSDGKEAMEGDHAKFVELHESGKLTKPEDPGHVLAALASNPPKVMSGAFVSWDEESMKPYRR